MERAPGIREPAHELAAIIDPIGVGAYGARGVDRGEAALVREKAMLRATDIGIEARDLAAIIDPEGPCQRGARDVDCGEDAVVQEKTCSVGSAGLTSTAQAIATSLLAYAGVGGVVV
jgi:hypothetical protein